MVVDTHTRTHIHNRCRRGSGHPVCAGVGPWARTRPVRPCPPTRSPVIGRSKAAHGRPFSNRADAPTGYRVTGRRRRTLGTYARRRRGKINYVSLSARAFIAYTGSVFIIIIIVRVRIRIRVGSFSPFYEWPARAGARPYARDRETYPRIYYNTRTMIAVLRTSNCSFNNNNNNNSGNKIITHVRYAQ